MRGAKRNFQKAAGIVLPAALVLFGIAEGVKWFRRKPPVGLAAPNAPGTPLTSLKLEPSAARPELWAGKSASIELRAGDRVAVWSRVEPMTPELPAQLAAVTLAVRLRSPSGAADAACSMHAPDAMWSEPCGDAICLRTAPACTLVAPAGASYTLEASVEWLPRAAPSAAALEAFVHRAP